MLPARHDDDDFVDKNSTSFFLMIFRVQGVALANTLLSLLSFHAEYYRTMLLYHATLHAPGPT